MRQHHDFGIGTENVTSFSGKATVTWPHSTSTTISHLTRPRTSNFNSYLMFLKLPPFGIHWYSWARISFSIGNKCNRPYISGIPINSNYPVEGVFSPCQIHRMYNGEASSIDVNKRERITSKISSRHRFRSMHEYCQKWSSSPKGCHTQSLYYASEYLTHLILMLLYKQTLHQILEELESMRLTEVLLKVLKIAYVIKNRLNHEQKSNYVACHIKQAVKV
jgi:hypothetical protein